MSYKTKQPTIQSASKGPDSTSTIPTVTFNRDVITVAVVVAQPKGASEPAISAPLVTIPYLGTWTLVWELRVLTAGLKAHFHDPGIVLPKTLPPRTTRLTTPTGTAAEWTVRLENEVQAEISFKYEIVIKSAARTLKEQAQIDLRHENSPTNFIPVQDPLDPPKPRLL